MTATAHEATTLGAGFADPVFQSQAAFRAVLDALAEPGTRRDVGAAIVPPAGLEATTAIILLTLADYETPIFLPRPLRDGPAGAWLRFHCGAALVEEPAQAAFAVVDGAQAAPALAAFHPGEDQFPDRSATVIVQCEALTGGAPVTLEGPGIAASRKIAPAGLREGFFAELAANAGRYPLGVDCLLTHGTELIGLPRSTLYPEIR